MEENVYRSELERLRFTKEGKAALTDALMAQQAAPGVRRRQPWMKRGAAAALAAVLLVGTAAAVTLPLWEDYFGPMDQGQLAVVEGLSETLPDAVTSNGASMTPLAAFGGQGALYLMLEVEAPEGCVLPTLGEDEQYWLSGGVEPEVRARLETAEGAQMENLSYAINVTCLEDGDPTDNKISLVVDVTADGDLSGLTLHIPGLWKWEEDGSYTTVFTGDFDFPISADMGEGCVTALDVTGVTTQTNWGPVTLETLELSPLGARWSYRIDEDTAQAAREAEQGAAEESPAVTGLNEDGSEMPLETAILVSPQMTLILKDGTEVSFPLSFQGQEDGLQVCSGSFAAPVDLSQADHLLWGDTQIPLA